MKRKIIKQGHNTLTLTLPGEWTRKLDLKAGDELDVLEKEASLVLSADSKKEEKRAVIEIKDLTVPMLWRYFSGAYRAGSNEIKFVFDGSRKAYEDAYHYYTAHFDYSKLGEKIPPKPAIAMIQGMVDRFIGMGIIESGKDYCIAREMGEPNIKEFDSSLKRIFLVISQMFDRIMEAIDKNEIKDPGLCKEMHTIDLNVDRLTDYCCRILNKITNTYSESKKMLLFSTIFMLEQVGDEFKYIGKHLAISKKPVKDTLPMAQKVKEHFNIYHQLFYNYDKNLAIKFGDSDYKVYNQHFDIKESLQGESRSIARHFMLLSKFILALTELRIEMEF